MATSYIHEQNYQIARGLINGRYTAAFDGVLVDVPRTQQV